MRTMRFAACGMTGGNRNDVRITAVFREAKEFFPFAAIRFEFPVLPFPAAGGGLFFFEGSGF